MKIKYCRENKNGNTHDFCSQCLMHLQTFCSSRTSRSGEGMNNSDQVCDGSVDEGGGEGREREGGSQLLFVCPLLAQDN